MKNAMGFFLALILVTGFAACRSGAGEDDSTRQAGESGQSASADTVVITADSAEAAGSFLTITEG